MSENLKVNAKTSTLEFKRKHNKLVDSVSQIVESAIQADKDIISKIKREYFEDFNLTTFTFPKGIMPLSITLNTHELYFKEDSEKRNFIVDYNGNEVEGYEMDDYYYNGEEMEIDFIGNLSEQVIYGLVYLSFNGNATPILDTYNLFYPQNATKLYRHYLTFDRGDGDVSITIITNSNTPIKIENTVSTLNIINNEIRTCIRGDCYNVNGEDTEMKILSSKFDTNNALTLYGYPLDYTGNSIPSMMAEVYQSSIPFEDITEDITLM